MINHTKIEFHDDRLKEIQDILDKLAPHEHVDGMNECHICDQQLDEAILIELRKLVPSKPEPAVNAGRARVTKATGVFADVLREKEASSDNALAVLRDIQAFLSVMFGQGEDCVIPEKVRSPIGVEIKLGDIMRDLEQILSSHSNVAGAPPVPENFPTSPSDEEIARELLLLKRWMMVYGERGYEACYKKDGLLHAAGNCLVCDTITFLAAIKKSKTASSAVLAQRKQDEDLEEKDAG